jgi:hypothetical protein
LSHYVAAGGCVHVYTQQDWYAFGPDARIDNEASGKDAAPSFQRYGSRIPCIALHVLDFASHHQKIMTSHEGPSGIRFDSALLFSVFPAFSRVSKIITNGRSPPLSDYLSVPMQAGFFIFCQFYYLDFQLIVHFS